jgi:ABC-2 type transport system permease protein
MTTLTAPMRSPLSGPLRGFSTTYVRHDLRRVLRNRRAMIFTLVMPTVLYLVFGASQKFTGTIGHANTQAYVMIHMAVYGAILATTANAASVALEQQVGWTRTLRLTRLSPIAYVVTKAMVAMSVAAMPLVALSIVGVITGASAPVGVWIGSVVLGWLGSAVFAAFGLAMGSGLRSEAAMQASGGVLTVLGFAGNVFVPLKGTMLTISQFTPMFGVNALANYPITGGVTPYGDHISIWVALANVVVWGALMAGAAAYFFRRSTERQ